MPGKPEWEARVVKQERRVQKGEECAPHFWPVPVSCCVTAQSHGTIAQGALWTVMSQDSLWMAGWGRGKDYLLSPSIGPSFVPQHFISPTFLVRASIGAAWVLKELDLSSHRERIPRAQGEKRNNHAWGQCSSICSRDIGFPGTRTGVEGVTKSFGDNDTKRVQNGTKEVSGRIS